MSRHDSLGDRMKHYESINTQYLTPRTPVIIRLDGKAFHTWTKGIEGSFNDGMHEIMMQVTGFLCEQIQNAVFGYTQSDEITIVLKDWGSINTSTWFGNRQNKIESVAASMATAKFNELVREYLPEKAGKLAFFDARAFNVPRDEVVNNLIWRQNDATRNSVQMLGRMHFSHRQLHKKSSSDIQEMLFQEHGINWNNIDTWKRRGAAWIRIEQWDPVGESDYPVKVWERHEDMPILKDDRSYVDTLLKYDNEE